MEKIIDPIDIQLIKREFTAQKNSETQTRVATNYTS